MRGPEQLCLEFKLSYKLSHKSLNSRVWGGERLGVRLRERRVRARRAERGEGGGGGLWV